MKYLLAIAAFLAGAIYTPALKAQSFRAMPGLRGGIVFHSNGSGFHPFFGVSPAVFPPFWGYPSNYPFEYFYPGLWPPLDYQNQQAALIANGDVAAEVAAQEKAYLSSQVKELSEELRSLREEQAAGRFERAAAISPRTEVPLRPSTREVAPAPQEFPSTVFVYRDGREMEVRDYAIFGDTLWVFQGERAHKFALADFNLEASRQVNEEHGVEFPLSNRHSQ